MLEREAGYERQIKSGQWYYYVEDHYIELTIVKTEPVEKPKLPEITPVAVEPIIEEVVKEPEV